MAVHDSGGSRRVRVLVVDHERMVGEGLAGLLARERDLDAVGVAVGAAEALGLAEALHPQVVVVDQVVPDAAGLRLTEQLTHRRPPVRVVLLTGAVADRVLLGAVEAGCSCLLTRERPAADLVAAVRSAAAGEAMVPPDLLTRLLPAMAHAAPRPADELTDREREILALLALGWGNPRIAEELHLSVNTVRNYIQAVLQKLGVHSRLEAVAAGVRAGVIEYPAVAGAAALAGTGGRSD